MRSTQRALEQCREDLGWTAELVEKPWNPHSRVRKDCFGLFDILALDGSPGCLGIQACGADVSSHIEKIRQNTVLHEWLKAGNRLQIWAFRKLKLYHGSKAVRWRCKIIDVKWICGAPVFEVVTDNAE